MNPLFTFVAYSLSPCPQLHFLQKVGEKSGLCSVDVQRQESTFTRLSCLLSFLEEEVAICSRILA